MAEPRSLIYGSEILRRSFSGGGISRAKAAEALGLDRATITRIVKKLVAKGYLCEQGPDTAGSRSQGRRRTLLAVPDSMGCAMGFEVQHDRIRLAAVRPSGKSCFHGEVPRNPDQQLDPDELVRVARLLMEKLKGEGIQILGAGFALSGLVDPVKGSLLFSPGLCSKHHPLILKDVLEEQLQLPVYMDNDAKCCCYDVLTYSRPAALQDFLYVFCEFPDDPDNPECYLRVQFGMALVLQGRVHYGYRNAAGEYRSVFADAEVPGQFGYREHNYFRYIKTDQEKRKLFFDDLGRNIAFIANFLDLQTLYLGGGIERYRQEFLEALHQSVKATWLYEQYMPRNLPVCFAETDEKPAVRGAASLVLRRILVDRDRGSGLAYLHRLQQCSAHGEGQDRVYAGAAAEQH